MVADVLSLFSSPIYSCLLAPCWCCCFVIVAVDMDGFVAVMVMIQPMWILFLYSSMLLCFVIGIMLSSMRMFFLTMLPAANGHIRIWSPSFYLSFQFQTNLCFIHFLCSHLPFSLSVPLSRQTGGEKKKRQMTNKVFSAMVSIPKKKRFSCQEKRYRDLSFVLSLRIVYTHAPSSLLVILSTIS